MFNLRVEENEKCIVSRIQQYANHAGSVRYLS